MVMVPVNIFRWLCTYAYYMKLFNCILCSKMQLLNTPFQFMVTNVHLVWKRLVECYYISPNLGLVYHHYKYYVVKCMFILVGGEKQYTNMKTNVVKLMSNCCIWNICITSYFLV